MVSSIGRLVPRVLAASLLVAALLLSGCAGGAASAPSAATRTAAPTASATAGRLDEMVRGLTSPWEALALDDESLLVSERDTGRIVRVDGDRMTEVRRLAEVDPGGEGGLLGLALGSERDTLFAYFTAAEDNRIVAMSWNGTELGEPQVILDGIPKGGRHNGGRIVLGPDGFLYVGTGEVGDTRLAQERASLGGKILRITVEGQPAPGNPYGNAVWSYGHRNVEGLAFDPEGRLWASEFGEQSWDELNLITKGANYGWPEVEGSGTGEGLTNPKVVWRTDEASPAGLAYADGALWMAALRGERLWQIPVSGTEVGEPRSHYEGEHGRIRTVTPVPGGGALLVVTSNTDGRGDVRDGDDRIFRFQLS
jgi:glucose/arabinose dehydrogenase